VDDASLRTLFKAKRVLVVDPSVYTQRAMSEFLEPLGIGCNTVASVAVGLARMVQHPQAYHLLFIDQALPEMAAGEITRTLRAFTNLAKLPIVLLASQITATLPTYIQKAGFAGHLVKPISSSALLNMLTSLLRADTLPLPKTTADKDPPEFHFKGKILLVEDYLPNQKMARYMLEEMGCDVDVAASGEEALEQLQAHRYDVVLMDCQMPEMDGFQATAEIRKHDYGQGIIIIAMTANALQGDREKCLQAGMNDYIGKPVRFEDLGRLLSKYLTG
jgi:CheY-like chemotaxis protein